MKINNFNKIWSSQQHNNKLIWLKKIALISSFVSWSVFMVAEAFDIWRETKILWSSCFPDSSLKIPDWFRTQELCAEIKKIEKPFFIEQKNRVDSILWTANEEFEKTGFDIIDFWTNWTFWEQVLEAEKYFVETDKKDFDFLSNIDGKISDLMVSLWSNISISIIDILKHKIASNENFNFFISYSNPRDLLDFLNLLKSENVDLEIAKKYIKLVKIPKKMSGNVWLRDNLFPVKNKNLDNDDIWFVFPNQFGYSSIDINNINQSWLASKLTDKKFTVVPVFLEWWWWNIIHDSDKVFIWVDTIIRWYIKYKISLENSDLINIKIDNLFLEEAKKFYEDYFKKPLIVIWGIKEEMIIYSLSDIYNIMHQEIYHIDLFITPLWGKNIAVAKPLNSWMENIYKNLKNQWYNIYEIPFIWWWKFWTLSISYNNVLIEKYNSGSYVYVPQYNNNTILSELWKNRDLEAIKAWEKTGFTVIPVRVDLNTLEWWWSLHCRMVELNRK